MCLDDDIKTRIIHCTEKKLIYINLLTLQNKIMPPSGIYTYCSEFNPKIKCSILETIFYEENYSHFNQSVSFSLKIDFFHHLYYTNVFKITDFLTIKKLNGKIQKNSINEPQIIVMKKTGLFYTV